MKRNLNGAEYRTYLSELRAEAQDGKRQISGHAAVFDKLSEQMYGFREVIRKGAFAKTIQEADVRALWNHDTNLVLGRNKAGTLRLVEDEVGLRVEIDPPKATWAEDKLESIRRGDVSQMSFAFKTIKDRWFTEGGEDRRELLEVQLFEVSPVTFPAYPDTDVSARALAAATASGSDNKIFKALMRLNEGAELSEEEIRLVRNHIETIAQRVKPSEPGDHSEAQAAPAEPPTGHSLEIVRKKLDILEKETN